MTILTVNPCEPEHGREFTLWTSAALVVCALHVGLAAAYLLLKPQPEARAEAPAFEVAFVPATTAPAPAVPETQPSAEQPPTPDQSSVDPPTETPPPPQAVVPEPDPPPAKEEATVQPEPEPPPPVQAETLVQPEPTPPPLALNIPEPPAEPKVPEQVAVLPPQVAVLPPPETKPAEVAPPPEKTLTPPPEHSMRKPTPEAKVQKESRKPPPKPAAAPSSRPARVAMAPNPGADSEGAREGRTSWQSELVAHIRRFATYNSQSNESGSVSISVTIDRNGRLKSRHLVSSSGSATLDRVAMDLLERAQPFPLFPPSMTEAQVVRTVPLHLRPR